MNGGPINIVIFDSPEEPEIHPCALGVHQWAWLLAGGIECVVCGARR